MNIFEQAARDKLRFASGIGDLTAEQLWDLPLTPIRGQPADLDNMARAVHAELKGLQEVSFVEVKPDPRKSSLELQLEILKFVIADKVEQRDSLVKKAENQEIKRKLTEALAAKQTEKLSEMSEDDIKKQLAKLED